MKKFIIGLIFLIPFFLMICSILLQILVLCFEDFLGYWNGLSNDEKPRAIIGITIFGMTVIGAGLVVLQMKEWDKEEKMRG